MSVTDGNTDTLVPQNLQVACFSSHAFGFLEMFWFLFLKYLHACKCSFGSSYDSIKVSHFFQGFYLFYNVCLFNFILLPCLFAFEVKLKLI